MKFKLIIYFECKCCYFSCFQRVLHRLVGYISFMWNRYRSNCSFFRSVCSYNSFSLYVVSPLPIAQVARRHCSPVTNKLRYVPMLEIRVITISQWRRNEGNYISHNRYAFIRVKNVFYGMHYSEWSGESLDASWPPCFSMTENITFWKVVHIPFD